MARSSESRALQHEAGWRHQQPKPASRSNPVGRLREIEYELCTAKFTALVCPRQPYRRVTLAQIMAANVQPETTWRTFLAIERLEQMIHHLLGNTRTGICYKN